MIKEDTHNRPVTPSGLGRARLALAISAGKLAGASGRLLGVGGGTSLPGLIARRIDPNVLKSVVGASQARKIVITGSNGKTTTARMTAAMAVSNGKRVSHNRAGSNMLQGVTAVAVNFADVFGRLNSDVLLFEIDEGTMPLVMPEIQPDVVVITNIFRDQLDRYGELYSVARALDKTLEDLPETSTILLNGNDPQVANFGQKAKAKRLFFGLESTEVGTPVPEQSADIIRCINCQEDLVYEVAYMSHLGIYRCPNCGYKLPPLDIAATSINLILRLIAQHPGKKHMLLAASHTIVDGEDFSWLWDIDVEAVAQGIEDVVCSGNKPEELAMRLKYAEIPVDKISLVEDREAALDAALKNAGPGGALYILSSYTPTNELRRIMQKRGWVKHTWQE